MNPTSEWQTVATHSWLQEALMTKALLEGSGIEAFIPEEHVTGVNPFATAMTIRVQVRSTDAEQARALLADVPAPASDDEASPGSCSICGQSLVPVRPTGLRKWVDFAIGMLVGVPLRSRRKPRCPTCAKSYRPPA